MAVVPPALRAFPPAGHSASRTCDDGTAHRIYAKFSDAIHQAVADSETLLVNKIQDVGDGDWKAHAHVLRYRHQLRWGTDKSEVESHSTIDVKQELAEVLGKINLKHKPKTGDEPDETED